MLKYNMLSTNAAKYGQYNIHTTVLRTKQVNLCHKLPESLIFIYTVIKAIE